jgi:hypothetical protein
MSFLSKLIFRFLAPHDPVNPVGVSQNNGQKDDHRKNHQVQDPMTRGGVKDGSTCRQVEPSY